MNSYYLLRASRDHKSVIHVFSFRMTDHDRDENTVNDARETDNDQALLLEATRDTSHATTNLETLMHLFKVDKSYGVHVRKSDPDFRVM